MAEHGYEQTPMAAIARQAGTSESQLMRDFGGKAGPLETIFDDSWGPLNARVDAVTRAAGSSAEALIDVLTLFIDVLNQDSALGRLFLFEGRRLRGDGINLSRGYLQYLDLPVPR